VIAGEDHLQGDDAFEPALGSFVNDAHRAAAQDAEDLVAGDHHRLVGGLARPFRRLIDRFCELGATAAASTVAAPGAGVAVEPTCE